MDTRRLVRVVNAPPEARRHPPRILRHYHDDALHQRGFEPVGKYYDRASERDLDYVVVRTRAGDALLAMLRDEADPSVFVHGSVLETTFEW
jgi:hypothetical protein